MAAGEFIEGSIAMGLVRSPAAILNQSSILSPRRGTIDPTFSITAFPASSARKRVLSRDEREAFEGTGITDLDEQSSQAVLTGYDAQLHLQRGKDAQRLGVSANKLALDPFIREEQIRRIEAAQAFRQFRGDNLGATDKSTLGRRDRQTFLQVQTGQTTPEKLSAEASKPQISKQEFDRRIQAEVARIEEAREQNKSSFLERVGEKIESAERFVLSPTGITPEEFGEASALGFATAYEAVRTPFIRNQNAGSLSERSRALSGETYNRELQQFERSVNTFKPYAERELQVIYDPLTSFEEKQEAQRNLTRYNLVLANRAVDIERKHPGIGTAIIQSLAPRGPIETALLVGVGAGTTGKLITGSARSFNLGTKGLLGTGRIALTGTTKVPRIITTGSTLIKGEKVSVPKAIVRGVQAAPSALEQTGIKVFRGTVSEGTKTVKGLGSGLKQDITTITKFATAPVRLPIQAERAILEGTASTALKQTTKQAVTQARQLPQRVYQTADAGLVRFGQGLVAIDTGVAKAFQAPAIIKSGVKSGIQSSIRTTRNIPGLVERGLIKLEEAPEEFIRSKTPSAKRARVKEDIIQTRELNIEGPLSRSFEKALGETSGGGINFSDDFAIITPEVTLGRVQRSTDFLGGTRFPTEVKLAPGSTEKIALQTRINQLSKQLDFTITPEAKEAIQQEVSSLKSKLRSVEAKEKITGLPSSEQELLEIGSLSPDLIKSLRESQRTSKFTVSGGAQDLLETTIDPSLATRVESPLIRRPSVTLPTPITSSTQLRAQTFPIVIPTITTPDTDLFTPTEVPLLPRVPESPYRQDFSTTIPTIQELQEDLSSTKIPVNLPNLIDDGIKGDPFISPIGIFEPEPSPSPVPTQTPFEIPEKTKIDLDIPTPRVTITKKPGLNIPPLPETDETDVFGEININLQKRYKLTRKVDFNKVEWTLISLVGRSENSQVNVEQTWGPYNINEIITSELISRSSRRNLENKFRLQGEQKSDGSDLVLSLLALGKITVSEIEFVLPFPVNVSESAVVV